MAKHNAYYSDTLKVWQTKFMGHKPTDEQFHQAHGLGCRPGVQALFVAMMLRAEGCTIAQFQTAGSCGPANNKRRELENAKVIKVTVEGKPYAYKAVLTEKGKAVIAKYDEAATAEPAEKGKAKKAKPATKRARKPKATPANEPANDTAQVHAASDVPQGDAETVIQA